MSKGSLSKRGANQPSFLERVAKETGSTLDALAASASTVEGCAILVLDISGSMAGGGFDEAKAGAKDYAKTAMDQGYRVGLVVFGSSAEEVIAPTDELAALSRAINGLSVCGSTNMAAGLNLALKRLLKMDGKRAITLVTDGVPDSESEAYDAAQSAKEAGVHIATIGTEDADWNFLKLMASSEELATLTQGNLLGAAIGSSAKLLPSLGSTKLLG